MATLSWPTKAMTTASGSLGPSGTTQHPVASGAAISSVFEQRDCRIDEGSRGAVSCPFAHHRGPCAYLGWQRIGPKAAAGLAKMYGWNELEKVGVQKVDASPPLSSFGYERDKRAWQQRSEAHWLPLRPMWPTPPWPVTLTAVSKIPLS
jgi:hypothetical protein